MSPDSLQRSQGKGDSNSILIIINVVCMMSHCRERKNPRVVDKSALLEKSTF